MELSIVIPCYKEEQILMKTVTKIQEILYNYKGFSTYEIILVIENSGTRTLEIAREISQMHDEVTVLENDKCYGKGYTVRRGVLESKGNLVLVTDADLPVDINRYFQIMLLLMNSQQAGAVYFTAFGDKADPRKRGLVRSQMTFGLFALRNFFLNQSISDTQLGCKLYLGNAARKLFANVSQSGFLYELEMTDLLIDAGYTIEECAVRITEFSKESSVNIKLIYKSIFSFIGYCYKRKSNDRKYIVNSHIKSVELENRLL